ncbi:MAG: hypothetical protein KJO40_18205 [Deltaproteobacteria bacterium]|nr:hypothetical protein [Deltaproteobacteria bacterium]
MARCKSCGAEIRWIKTTAGNPMPCNQEQQTFVTPDGQTLRGHVPHWATCPHSKQWKRGAQRELF